MSRTPLTPGAISQMWADRKDFEPIVQVIDVRKIGGTTPETERYRLVLSDGEHYQQGMLATQRNSILQEGLALNSIVKLKKFLCNNVQNRRVAIVLDLELIHASVPNKIGEPANIESAGLSHNAPAPAPMYQQAQQRAPQQQQQQQPPQRTSGNPYHVKSEPVDSHPQQQQHHQQQQRFAPQQHQQQQQQQQQQAGQPSQQSRNAPVMRNTNESVFPIRSLNPYQNKWAVLGRVTSKKEIRTYHNHRGDGKLFSFDLLDAEGGEIKITAFNQECERFFDLVEVGKMYKVSRGSVKPANRRFSSLACPYEITLDQSSTIEPVNDSAAVPHNRFDFRALNSLMDVTPEQNVDVIGLVHTVGEASLITARQRQVSKREVQLVDESQQSVRLTLWGAEAESFQGTPFATVLAVKGARVSDFGGRSLSVGRNSTLSIDPPIPEADALREWYRNNGDNIQMVQYVGGQGARGDEPRKVLAAIQDEGLGRNPNGKPDYFQARVTVSMIPHGGTRKLSYPACPKCLKKVVEDLGNWKCERCDQPVSDALWRYILSVQCKDHTTSQYVSLFDDSAAALLGASAGELKHLQDNDDSEEFERVFEEKTFTKFVVTMRVKEEVYMDEPRVKTVAVSMTPIDYKAESRKLLDEINAS